MAREKCFVLFAEKTKHCEMTDQKKSWDNIREAKPKQESQEKKTIQTSALYQIRKSSTPTAKKSQENLG